jgi:predicted nucleic acid-binding protein
VILLVDTSVVLKWVHDAGESEVDQARALLGAHRAGAARLLVLDLCLYEFGNVLLRRLRLPAPLVAEQLALLHRLCGPVVHPAPSWHGAAAVLGEQHGLTFYDASWAAAAQALSCPLVSADRALIAPGLATSPSEAVALLSG